MLAAVALARARKYQKQKARFYSVC